MKMNETDATPTTDAEFVRLAIFARDVKAIAATLPSWTGAAPESGWGHKVYICDVHAAYAVLPVKAFKSFLVAAQRAGLLSLSRNDLPAAGDVAKAVASETCYLEARWHLVTV